MSAKLLNILYMAIETPHGVAVKGADSDKLKAAFYSTRTKAQDPDLNQLSIRTSPDDPAEEVWIMKKGKPNAEETL